MYWAVISMVVAFEYLAEWLISWQVSFFLVVPRLTFFSQRLPFYWEIKTVFLLFLSLPQSQVHLSTFPLLKIILLTHAVLQGINIRVYNISPAVLSAKRDRFGCWDCYHPAQRDDFHSGEIDSCLGPILVPFKQEHSYPTFRELRTISTFPVVMALFQRRLAFGYQPCTTRTRRLPRNPDNLPLG